MYQFETQDNKSVDWDIRNAKKTDFTGRVAPHWKAV